MRFNGPAPELINGRLAMVSTVGHHPTPTWCRRTAPERMPLAKPTITSYAWLVPPPQVGFLAGALEESSKGTPLLVQVEEMTLQTALLLAVLVYASLTPILKGAKMEPFGEAAARGAGGSGLAAARGLVG